MTITLRGYSSGIEIQILPFSFLLQIDTKIKQIIISIICSSLGTQHQIFVIYFHINAKNQIYHKNGYHALNYISLETQYQTMFNNVALNNSGSMFEYKIC